MTNESTSVVDSVKLTGLGPMEAASERNAAPAQPPVTAVGQGNGTAEKLLGLCALVMTIELVFFKFVPDLGNATVQHGRSLLASFDEFHLTYLDPAGGVHYARFLGNRVLYFLAKQIAAHIRSGDPRLTALRLAAAILTPLYACLGAYPALRNGSRLDWGSFFAPYALAVVVALYVFDPGDIPSAACLSLALGCLLEERLFLSLLLTLLAGLFRESAFHMVVLVGAWAVCARQVTPRARLAWVATFGAAFAVEYIGIRHFFRAPLSANGTIILDPRRLFLDPGFATLSSICSVGLATVFPLMCLLRIRQIRQSDWRRPFFLLCCWMFPAWLVFYRMMDGNMSEFRLFLPVLLPYVFGLGYSAGWRPANIKPTH